MIDITPAVVAALKTVPLLDGRVYPNIGVQEAADKGPVLVYSSAATPNLDLAGQARGGWRTLTLSIYASDAATARRVAEAVTAIMTGASFIKIRDADTGDGFDEDLLKHSYTLNYRVYQP